MGRPTKAAARMRANRSLESIAENKKRLSKNCKRNAISRSRESPLARQVRLSQMRSYMRSQLSQESTEQHQQRLDVIKKRLSKETPVQREHRFAVIDERLSNESPQQRQQRVYAMREHTRNERPYRRTQRLNLMRQRNLEIRQVENEEQRRERLEKMRESSRRNRYAGEDTFLSTINEFADVPCGV